MKSMKQLVFVLSILFFFVGPKDCGAQQDSLAALRDSSLQKAPPKDYVLSTFGGTRLVNTHTTEIHKRGKLDLRISHRFGELKDGYENLWGIDGPANIRIGLDFSLLDNVAIGIGRSSNKKLTDAFLKIRMFRQTYQGFPVTIAWISSVSRTNVKDPNKGKLNAIYLYPSSRLAYMHQVLVSRKFTAQFSLQVAPTLIHYNLVEKLTDKNDMFVVPVIARYKFNRWLSATTEYGIRTFRYVRDKTLYTNSFSLGMDMETGGHVFQIFVGNSFGINEVQALPYTTGEISKGEVRIGFNVSRVF